jgi:hypothetical protein
MAQGAKPIALHCITRLLLPCTLLFSFGLIKMCGKVDPLWYVEMTPEAVTWYCLLHGLNRAIGKRRCIMAVLL